MKFIKNFLKEFNIPYYPVNNIENKRTFLSLLAYLKSQKQQLSNLLILNGDSYFELSEIETLISNTSKSKVLVEKMNNLRYKQGLNLKLENPPYVLDSPDYLPYFSYKGACFLNKKDLTTLYKSDLNLNLPYLKVFINHLNLDVIFTEGNSQINTYHSTKELIGGSFAGLSRANIVKKYANSKSGGLEKLSNEIKWLLSCPSEIKSYFPQVLDYKINSNEVYFIMPYYNLENLRSKIIKGKFTTEQSIYFIEKILNFMFDKMYVRKFNDYKSDFVLNKHFKRFYERIEKIKHIKPFNEILQSKEIIINHQSYENLPPLINKLEKFYTKTKLFKPSKMVMIHGDLHFQNMLIDEQNDSFLLADPRGELKGSDIYYDLGKLWHSCNGLYDLIHTDIAQTQNISKNNSTHFNLYMGNKKLLEEYDCIKNKLTTLMSKYPITQDKDWLLKILFSEVMHFSSLMLFHLKQDEVENRAMCLYLQAIKLTTKLLAIIQKDNNEY